jgi:hypothetical protein
MFLLHPKLYFKRFREGFFNLGLLQEINFNENCFLDIENTQIKRFEKS